MSYDLHLLRYWVQKAPPPHKSWTRLDKLNHQIAFGEVRASVQAIRRLAPQLTVADANYRLSSGASFFGPALTVSGRCRRYRLSLNAISLVGVWPLDAATGMRSNEDLAEMVMAIREAEKLWPERLSEPIWEDVLEGRLILNTAKGIQMRFWAALRYTMAGMLLGPASRWNPVATELELAMVFVTTEPALGMELVGTGLPYLVNFCGLCGAGISNKRCTYCGATFPQLPYLEAPSTDFPLPGVVVYELARAGYQFSLDPVEARKAHYRDWASTGPPPSTAHEGRALRSIEL